MSKSYEEILKELEKKYENTTYTPVEERLQPHRRNEQPISNVSGFNSNLSVQSKYNTLPLTIAKQNYETEKNKVSEMLKNKGIDNSLKNGFTPSYFPSIQRLDSLKKPYNFQNVVDQENERNETLKNYNDLIKTDEYKVQYENYLQARDIYGYSQYQNNLEKVDNENINLWDKTGGRLISGLTNIFNHGPNVRNEEGKWVELPSYNDLKNSKASENSNFLEKIIGDSAFEIGKIATSAALNAVIPYAGSATYFGDMYGNAYNNAVLEGHNNDEALAYAVISTATEFATEKALGGLTKTLTGGGTSVLNQGIANGLSKIMNNKTAIKLLSHAGAEATEEFIQEYLDNFTRNVTLHEDNDVFSAETFGNAMYSALVGGITGAFGGIGDNSLNIPTKENINNNVNNQQNNQTLLSQKNENIMGYTKKEIENYKNGKVKIVQNSQDISNFVESSQKIPSNAKLYFGKIGTNVANKIKNVLGINIENYNLSLPTDAVRHIIKNHGDNSIENSRGQVAVTADDFKLIPQIVSDFDSVEQSGTTENNNQAITFQKLIGDNYYLVSYISDKNHNLEVKTMWKIKANEKNSATASDAIMPRSGTSVTDNGTSPFSNENNSTNNSQSQIAPLPTINNMQENQNNTLKEKQLDIILNYNPAGNETATWIRNVDDIKTFEETLQDSDWEGWEKNGFDPDYDANMVQEALNTGKITVYSSYPIEQGIFVTPSKMEAESYSGTGKVYSKEINLTDVAWIDPTQGQFAKVNDIKIPTSKDGNNLNFPPVEPQQNNTISNPLEISQLTPEDANTTPSLPTYKTVSGEGESSFFSNVTEKSKFLNKDIQEILKNENDIKYYKEITNKDTLEKAYQKLQNGGESESLSWFNRNGYDENGKYKYKPTAEDVAEGWILLKQYQDAKDYDGVVQIAKKMREIGTQAGQTVQAFNVMERLTPEGMVEYAQSELMEAYDKMIKNKSQEWINKHRGDFELTADDVQFIMDNMKEVSTMEDGYDKRVKLAEIQKLMTDKLPSTTGTGIKSWMRISMLFNPKTQVRNVVGNAIIMPVNSFSDLFSNYADKIIAKKTGVRTTGKTNVKAILKGMKEGAYQATNDYKKGINTKDMQGNRFEIGEGKSFNDKTLMGKSLNRVEGMLNYVMDAGDRVFSQAAFENSLQNQLVLNNTTEITQDMLDIARTESLQRTWNDNNNYTRFVLKIRKGLNQIHLPGVDSYGLGDILIPFAKTPANLTKAIVDYSPAGLVKTLIEGNNLKKSLSNGQFNSQIQHQFVQDLGKATAGTMLYVLGYGLAKAGITSGESDDDKDVSNFMKNTLGISSYSIKIGDKSFTYDWAQPIAAPLSITANIVNSKNNKGQALLEGITSSLDTAGSILLEQSFLQSINEVFNDNDGVVSGLINEMLDLPARAVPTFSKQIAELVDDTQRTSFEYNQPLKSALNSVIAKIPFASKTLAPSVDSMGREIKRYGGKNNLFNVFLNPANVNTENISESAKEIYEIYKSTGDATIMPRVAPYYVNSKGEKMIMNSEQRAEYQKIAGNIIEDNVLLLMKSNDYSKMNDSGKANLIKSVVDYAYNKARKDVLDIEMSNTYNKVNEYVSDGGKIADYYLHKDEINYSLENPDKYSIIMQIANYNDYQKYKKEIDTIREKNSDKKTATINYINSLKMNIPQKAMFIKIYYSSFDNYNTQIIEYINNQKMSLNEKAQILKQLGFEIKDGRVYW